MRPTELGVPIPPNKTPGPAYPKVSRTGHSLSFNSQSFSFGSSKRFSHYDEEYKKTGFRLGPGIHRPTNYDISATRKSHAPLYRPHSQSKDVPVEGYYIAGNLLVYDEKFIGRTRRAVSKSLCMAPAQLSSETAHSRRVLQVCVSLTFDASKSEIVKTEG